MTQVRVPVWFLVAQGLLLVGVSTMYVADRLRPGRTLPTDGLAMLELVHDRIRRDYVDDVGEDQLLLHAAGGMTSALDRYSEFVPPARVEEFEEHTTGAYAGIGVLMMTDRVPVTVLYPFPGGPAETAGLRPGDRILAADGEPLTEVAVERASELARAKLLGAPGTEVRVRVAREGREPFEVAVERGRIQQRSARWARLLDAEAGLGYVLLGSFQNETAAELDAELAWLADRAAAAGGLRGLVLDVRHNAGGLLDECTAVVNRFLHDGTIVSLRRRGEEVDRIEADPRHCTHPDLPLVVLQDGVSASASEVLAGALQDHGRARIVGPRSFGQGFVQTIYRWQDRPFQLKLTTSHYYTPAGRNIQRTLAGVPPAPADGGTGARGEAGDGPGETVRGGIEPDIEVALPDEVARRVVAGLTATEIPRDYRDEVVALAARIGYDLRLPVGADGDPQLAAALAELRRIVAGADPADGGGEHR